jgi:predicted TIM-barrel fold metal-dependent hydrolase
MVADGFQDGEFVRDWRERAEAVDRSFTQTSLLANASAQAEQRGFRDMLIVDCDFHQTETQSWAEILKYVDNEVLQHFLRVGGRGKYWVPASVATNDIQEVSGRIRPQRTRDEDPGEWGAEREVRLTLETLNAMGTDYVLSFPTALLSLGVNPFVELEAPLARAHARWMTEEILAADPRILTMLFLPFNDPKACIELVEEFADKPGVAGFMITTVRTRPVHHRDYMPLYRALEERNIPLGFHTAFSYHEQTMQQFNKFISVHTLGFPYYNMVHVINWIMNGLPERFPGLKVMWIESGLAWVPFIMQRLDHEFMMRSSEGPLLTRLPSEYMRDMYYTSQPMEAHGNLRALEMTFEMINAESQLLYASDWPHWDFDLPSRIYDLPFLTDEAKRRVLGLNAQELFGLPDRVPSGARRQNAATAS